ncbi:MAG TPA: hypothetical protein DCE42_15185 [Myxococcales bacterium]|nr:hypothetical protein [Myxococcales bacterium]
MIKALSLRWMSRAVAILLVALFTAGMSACGGGTSCPSCLAILLEIPKPTNASATASESEQIRLTLTVKNVDAWVIPTTTSGLKKQGNLWLFETDTNKNVQVIVADSEEITNGDQTLLAIKKTQMAFALSSSGRDNLRNGGMMLRVLSATTDSLQYKEGGVLQTAPKAKSDFAFEIKGEWRGEGGECLDSFTLGGDVSFATQSSASAQKATWSGSCN